MIRKLSYGGQEDLGFRTSPVTNISVDERRKPGSQRFVVRTRPEVDRVPRLPRGQEPGPAAAVWEHFRTRAVFRNG